MSATTTPSALELYKSTVGRALALGPKRPGSWSADLDVTAVFYDELEMELNISAARASTRSAGANIAGVGTLFGAAIKMCRPAQDALHTQLRGLRDQKYGPYSTLEVAKIGFELRLIRLHGKSDRVFVKFMASPLNPAYCCAEPTSAKKLPQNDLSGC
ncbi:hypothetical protein SCHPADRAFT_894462 [Schizopora paradoxa]|uniref:Uncharacterized protein n=1 Tax=Schizopora paradoxa TaxID=27342 RepID=A0A0H2R773_9AGAM|nr:hypothetical protein SCHPADRAFT_894462 [Schizopora paradoxa]